MEIGIAIAIDRLMNAVNKFDPDGKYDLQLTDAEMIRESAAVIADSTDEEIVEALKEGKQRSAGRR